MKEFWQVFVFYRLDGYEESEPIEYVTEGAAFDEAERLGADFVERLGEAPAVYKRTAGGYEKTTPEAAFIAWFEGQNSGRAPGEQPPFSSDCD